jgi:hypothetical protein
MIASLTEDQLDKRFYLQAGEEALDAVRFATQDPTLDHKVNNLA